MVTVQIKRRRALVAIGDGVTLLTKPFDKEDVAFKVKRFLKNLGFEDIKFGYIPKKRLNMPFLDQLNSIDKRRN